jgi:hypothetical protein
VIPTVVDDPSFNAPPTNFADVVRARFFYDPHPASGIDRSLRTYIHATSYGRAQLVADVFAPVTVQFRRGDCGAMQDEALATLPAGHSYEYACVVFTGGCPGHAFFGDRPFPGTTSLRKWCYVALDQELGVWAMELSHIMCDFDDLYKTADAHPGRFDNMACSCGTHPSTFTKLKFGWLNPTDVRTMAGADTRTFTLHAVGLLQPPPPGRAVAVRIASDLSPRYFLVEARLAVDVYERQTAGVSAGIPSEGVVVYEIDERVWAPVHRRTPNALSLGQTYTNPAEQLEIAVTSEVAGGFTVRVHSSEHPDCARIRAAIAEAGANINRLQEDLGTAAPGEKAEIMGEIREWQATLKKEQQRGAALGCHLP